MTNQPVTKLPEIAENLQALTSAIEVVDVAIENLEKRLVPVIIPSEIEKELPIPLPSETPLGGRLADLESKVRGLSAVIEHLCNRVRL